MIPSESFPNFLNEGWHTGSQCCKLTRFRGSRSGTAPTGSFHQNIPNFIKFMKHKYSQSEIHLTQRRKRLVGVARAKKDTGIPLAGGDHETKIGRLDSRVASSQRLFFVPRPMKVLEYCYIVAIFEVMICCNIIRVT